MFDLFSDTAEKPLRPHQQAAIDMVRHSLGTGHKHPVLQLATGAGKSRIAAEIVNMALAKGNQVAFTVPAISLIDQSVKEFAEVGIHRVNVMQGNHPRKDPMARVHIISVQSLLNRDRPKVGLVIVDECFVAGTMIAMADGTSKAIEEIRLGDRVLNAMGEGQVTARSATPASETYRIEFEDGRHVECTGNHPFFTENGWVEARALVNGSRIVGVEGMPDLWRGVRPDLSKRPSDARDGMAGANDLLAILLQEAGQPCEAPGSGSQGVTDAASYWSQATSSRRQRGRVDGAAESPACGARGWLGAGARRECLEGHSQSGGAGTLQDRHSASCDDDCNRGGWSQPLPEGEAGSGQAEGRIPGWGRVASVSRIERARAVPVYNLQVSGHPSYFADGRLVHNCHIRHRAILDWMRDEPKLPFVGLSATPWARGMADAWDDLLRPVTMQALIDAGYLSPFRVFAPSHPDLTTVRTKAGDYHEGDLSSVMSENRLVADVVTTWKQRAAGLPTLVFAVDRAHAEKLQAQFAASGVAMGYCDAHVDRVARKVLFDQLAAGKIAGICNVGTLTTGVDADIRCVVLARPTKSEMLFVQMIGRGLRLADGKDHCVILDHADNHARLGFVTDIHHGKLLSGTDKTPPTAREKGESTPKECPKCGVLLKSRECFACGFVAQRVSEVEPEPGELVEVKARKPKAAMVDKQAFWSMAQHVDAERGKGGKLALALFKAKFGVWPRGLDDMRRQPDAEFLSYERSRRIARSFAKRRAAA